MSNSAPATSNIKTHLPCPRPLLLQTPKTSTATDIWLARVIGCSKGGIDGHDGGRVVEITRARSAF
ncbi:hypothetical protein K469DRAFT_718773 [Zopfia rhizophila CBS 207.26]|uniref:Uncharacterized protein n=1 Tax=Zopfia rhizophila CBS 207.26 TaxID=1314779 RepID=A0A6A6ELC9_9PEZI|nr:hypothetical protein K469DRAFT_714111 [Zopfia rhizophila CBS 207.26]KAF2191752.1 hypothetical protein K469DRAFT_718773 [Zopfia rhizophila CBS 207.26]